jgi:hypothetical protein
MQLILKEKLEKILEKMKSDYKIKRLIAETYNDELILLVITKYNHIECIID